MIPIKDINPTERVSVVTLFLIVVNAAVYIFELMLGPGAAESFIATFALVPANLLRLTEAQNGIPVSATLFTSMFLHGGMFHVAGNMLYLWIFGNNIEDSMGRIRFVFFYFLCGIAAAYSHAFAQAGSMIPMIGASGAVSGVLGAYLLLYPRARVLTLVFFGFYVRTMAIPAVFVLGFWFVLQVLNGVISSGMAGGVAWYAHVGGFVAGMTLIGFFKRKTVPFGGRKRDDYL